MPYLASIIAMAAAVMAGLCLAMGLMVAMDGVFRGRVGMAFKAVLFALAIVALVCSMIFPD